MQLYIFIFLDFRIGGRMLDRRRCL